MTSIRILYYSLLGTATIFALALESPQTQAKLSFVRGYNDLPPPTWDNLQALVLFAGTGRSGSSLVGALLDAHPRIVVPHEYNLVSRMHNFTNKEQLYTELYNQASLQSSFRSGGGGYRYTVNGQWQGKAQYGRPFLIGDKKAAKTLGSNATATLDSLRQLIDFTGLPIKIVHVTRNPFDIIATTSLARGFGRTFGKTDQTDQSRHNFEMSIDAGVMEPFKFSNFFRETNDMHTGKLDTGSLLSQTINSYFRKMEIMNDLHRILDNNPNALGTHVEIITVDLDGLIDDPNKTLNELCGRLGVHCSEEYLYECAKIVWTSQHFTRLHVKWNQNHVCEVMTRAMQFPFLKHYMENGTVKAKKSEPQCWSQCFPGMWPCPCATGPSASFAVCTWKDREPNVPSSSTM